MRRKRVNGFAETVDMRRMLRSPSLSELPSSFETPDVTHLPSLE
jgi:hypothetical protein